MLEPRQEDEDDPRTVGSFHILGRLGRGGFGTVFAAHDHGKSAELVAVKVLRPPGDKAGISAERFLKEIEAIRRVQSDHVPRFLEGGVASNIGAGRRSSWFATELTPGLSLEELVKHCGPLTEGAVWRIGAGVIAALQAISAAGLVHRDLKPGNVLLAPDGPKIIDFGLVHLADRPHSQWSQEQVAGTFQYTPPEVLQGLHQGALAGDVFMLGGLLLYAATGHPPYAGDAASVVLQLRARNHQVNLSGLPPGDLRTVMAQCLDEAPERRPALAALAAIFAGQTDDSLAFADVLPACALDLLASFGQQLADYLASCPGGGQPDEAALTVPDRPAPVRIPQPALTREYTQADRRAGEPPRVTVDQDAHLPFPPVIHRVLPRDNGARDGQDTSWRVVRWACQFGAWIQAPVSIAGRVAIASDLDGTIGGFDALDGVQRWAFGLRAAVRSAAVLLPGRGVEVCLGDTDGGVHAVNVRDGNRRTLLRAGSAIYGPVAVDGNRVYALSADGRLHAIDSRAETSTVLFSARDLAPCPPAVLADMVFLATTQGKVLAVDAVSGAVRWSVSTGGRICAAPLPLRDRLYIAGTDGLLLEVDVLGRVRARASLGAPVHAELAHDGYCLYAGTSDGRVRAFSLQRDQGPELSSLWVTPLGDEIKGLTMAGGQLYAATGDCVLKLDPATRGAHGPVFRMECPVAAAPAVSAGLVYAVGLGGTVYCVSLS